MIIWFDDYYLCTLSKYLNNPFQLKILFMFQQFDKNCLILSIAYIPVLTYVHCTKVYTMYTVAHSSVDFLCLLFAEIPSSAAARGQHSSCCCLRPQYSPGGCWTRYVASVSLQASKPRVEIIVTLQFFCLKVI